jgi:ABC-type lipoprotein export system ATPase subunit
MTGEVAAGGVEVRALRHRFASQQVLDLPEFSLESGEQAVVVGPSGCGKTTLLSLLAGLMPPSEGRIRIASQDLSTLAARRGPGLDRFRARSIGLIPQQPFLFGVLDAVDNILAARFFAGLPPDRTTAIRLLEEVGLQGLEHRRPAQLSRGQQQRVALARALINQPALILADEPTANLDDERTRQSLALLRERAGALGATLLIATHDARVRSQFERVLVLPAPGTGGGGQ